MSSPFNFSHPPQQPSDCVEKLDKLLDSFEAIAALEEEARQQKIGEAAAIFQFSESSYRQQFEHYLARKSELGDKTHAPIKHLLQPVSLLDAKVSDLVDLLQELSLVKLSAVLGEAALLFAMVSYIEQI